MTELERQINRSLHALDRAHLMARITRGEYRERRRRLLTSLINDSHVVTARVSIDKSGAASAKTLQNKTAYNAKSPEAANPKLFTPRPYLSGRYLMAGAVGIIVVAVIIYLSLRGG
jgi:hypothetical protein